MAKRPTKRHPGQPVFWVGPRSTAAFSTANGDPGSTKTTVVRDDDIGRREVRIKFPAERKSLF